MFNRGRRYTRREIHEAVGGSLQSYLPHSGGRVVCGCFRTDLNPEAPRVVLVGRGPRIVEAAELLVRQDTGVPCFLKRGSNEWEYVGRYRAVRLTRGAAEITRASAGARRADVWGVLYLEGPR